MYMCNLYQDHSFERFLSFVEFELGKKNPLWQDEHIRRQSDFYTSAEVDCYCYRSVIKLFLRKRKELIYLRRGRMRHPFS